MGVSNNYSALISAEAGHSPDIASPLSQAAIEDPIAPIRPEIYLAVVGLQRGAYDNVIAPCDAEKKKFLGSKNEYLGIPLYSTGIVNVFKEKF